jgi:hypothetical protein
MKSGIYFFLILVCLASTSFAHEMRPAYLQLHQTGEDTYDAFWKVPGLGDDMRLSLYVVLPEGSMNLT